MGYNLDEYIESLLTLGYVNKLSIHWSGTTNWVQGIQKSRERLMELIGREDPVA